LDCVVILDRELNYIYANQASNNFLGLKGDTIEGKNMRDVLAFSPKFRDLWVQRLEQFFKTKEPKWAEDRINIGGGIFWSESSLAAIRNAAEQIVAVGIIYRDVSKRKQVEAERERLISELERAKKDIEDANQKLERLAALDGLTQLANRRMFDAYLVREWSIQARQKSPLSIIMCDIDYFKRYNDAYGHQAGDECLKQVADKLKDSVTRPTDLVARYGGEEFVLVLPDTNPRGAEHVAQRIIKHIKKLKIPHSQSDIDPYVTLSMGISYVLPHHHQSLEVLIKTADDALYEVKATGRNNYLMKECGS
jgi:diguanylate cyclase (GGDEF)-like protein/PAS domain S-box-containing protein